MKWIRNIISLICFCTIALVQVQAQDDYTTEADTTFSYDNEEDVYNFPQKPAVRASDQYFGDSVEVQKFNRKEWKKIVNGATFEEDPPEPEKQDYKTPDINPGKFDLSFLGGAAQVVKILLVVALIAVVVFVLYSFLKDMRWSSKKLENNVTSIADFDEELPELSALRKLLQQALANGDYKLAIRYYYLLLMAQFREEGLIVWKKDKTNRQYLYEMRQHNRITDIKTATRLFEAYWYGDLQPDANGFGEAETLFKSLLTK
ncbi:MAG: DUF4129 domain-containing protein [Chitinophagales bacterium]